MDTFRVMIVDDEPGIRHSVSRALDGRTVSRPRMETEVKFRTIGAESGEAALELLEAEPCDLMLLDYKMGGMSGLDVLQKLQDQPHDMLVVMVTAFATIETAVRATKQGAFDFIAKPFTPSELRDTIEKATVHLLAQRQARRLAEEKRRIRFDFIRVLGHELKSPLGAIESYLHLVKDRTAGDDIAEYEPMVERCLLRTEGMRKLITDLLDMTRIESGQKKRRFSDVDLVDVARMAIEAVSVDADEHGITLQLDGPETLVLTADRGEIEIIMNNLVSNAVKYNRDGGSVRVQLASDDDSATISVTDTGIGMKPEDAARLFNDFVRIKSKETREILGSGLGLSIVKKIAELYDGRASVESTEGVGSTFTVMLSRNTEPVSEVQNPQPQLAAAAISASEEQD